VEVYCSSYRHIRTRVSSLLYDPQVFRLLKHGAVLGLIFLITHIVLAAVGIICLLLHITHVSQALSCEQVVEHGAAL
jgi:membrane-bound ClpP family serine protease